jgi:hypothetical protein
VHQLELEKMMAPNANPHEQPPTGREEEEVAVVVELMARAILAILRPHGAKEVDDE